MAYVYRFIPSGDAIQLSPKQSYIDITKETLAQQFYESSDWWTISEETAFATGVYQNVDARVISAINPTTGEKLSDDFRKLLFSTLDHSVDLGKYYQFDDNYWITVDSDKIKTLASTVTIKRCNNMLKWMDEDGGVFEVPCSISYLIKENRDYSTAGSSLVVPSGMVEVACQSNSHSNKIKPNQRFLFGNPENWTAYRVEGGGIANFNLTKTNDNTSSGLIRFGMAVDYINTQTDDLTNGIADAVSQSYILSLNESSISGDATQIVQLQSTVYLNEAIVSRDVVWSSDNTGVATVTASGLVTFISIGSATITCSLSNNASVYDTCSVVVGSSPVDTYQITYSPNVDYVLEDAEKTWTVYLYKNSIQQADVFVFSLNSGSVPSAKYTYSVLGNNSFKIKNNGMYLTDDLEITCVSGIYSKVISVSLRGAW